MKLRLVLPELFLEAKEMPAQFFVEKVRQLVGPSRVPSRPYSAEAGSSLVPHGLLKATYV